MNGPDTNIEQEQEVDSDSEDDSDYEDESEDDEEDELDNLEEEEESLTPGVINNNNNNNNQSIVSPTSNSNSNSENDRANHNETDCERANMDAIDVETVVGEEEDEIPRDDEPIPELTRRTGRVPKPREFYEPSFKGKKYEEVNHLVTQVCPEETINYTEEEVPVLGQIFTQVYGLVKGLK